MLRPPPHSLQLFSGYAEIFPSQPRDNLPACPGCVPGFLSVKQKQPLPNNQTPSYHSGRAQAPNGGSLFLLVTTISFIHQQQQVQFNSCLCLIYSLFMSLDLSVSLTSRVAMPSNTSDFRVWWLHTRNSSLLNGVTILWKQTELEIVPLDESFKEKK